MVFHYHSGTDLTEANIQEIEATKTIPCFGTLGYGYLQMHQATTKTQRIEALRTVETGIKEFESLFGDAADLCLGAFLLTAYHKTEEYERGIRCANMLVCEHFCLSLT
jgi:hypothetical protein